jgi:aspartyl-tRNA(Asn)/glutamyl-tRNA(Gln) amidotransferase subunit C
MAVDKETVKRVARLARIAVSDGEAESLQGELNTILGFVEQLIEMKAKMRADVVADGGIADAIVANAPAGAEHFFAVPKVVE